MLLIRADKRGAQLEGDVDSQADTLLQKVDTDYE